jgi:MFS family permease
MNAPPGGEDERGGDGRGRAGALLLALTVGLVLADSSVVTLALPAILRSMHATVNGVAWVLIAFNLALALFALGGAWLARGRAREAFAASVGLFVLACLACAAAPSLAVLIAARAAQGVCGAVVVAAALALMVGSVGRRRAIALWAGAGVLGAAVGPAAGGFLTEWLSWEAMFALQAPLALVGLLGLVATRTVAAGPPVAPAAAAVPSARARPAVAPLVALTLASAALSAALFLLVILLIEGWRHSPGEAALAVTVMPLAALLAGGWARAHHRLVPAIAGMLLVGGGLAALGLLPGAEIAWTFAPQAAIGAGLGLALTTLIGESVGASGALARPAAWTIAARHAGIVVGLLLLTPIFTADLDTVSDPVQRAGFARVLDAPISLPVKIDVARELDRQVSASAGAQELPDLDAAFARLEVPADQRPAVDTLHAQLDDELDRGATDAFSRSFLVAALLALLAGGAALVAALPALGARVSPSSNGSPTRALAVALPGAGAAALLLAAVYVALGGGDFVPRAVADPCMKRARPAGVERTQLAALAVLDGTSCALRTPRETLLRTLLERRRPAGVSEDELVDALGDGVDRARDERALSALEATGLRIGLRVGGAVGVVGLVLGD